MPAQIIKVSQLNRYVKAQLEENPLLGDLLVKGELTSMSRRSGSGYFYFTVSEGDATLRCVMFARYAERVPAFPQEGDTVIVRGAITLYERDGQYQLSAYDIQSIGQGTGSVDYTALRQKLLAEGLLSPERKRPAPRFPRAVGVITSAEGAAVQDIITGMGRHNDLIPIVLYPATVQGTTAVEEMLYALRCAVAENRCDVIIIARGGGAAETLAVFNDERLLRAAAASPVPIVSAVGHDVDITLLDEVADLRAATPTAACQYCCISKAELLTEFSLAKNGLQRAMKYRLYGLLGRTDALQRVLRARSPQVLYSKNRQRLDYLTRLLQGNMQHILWRLTQQAGQLHGQLELLDPALPVERGYSITYTVRQGEHLPLYSCRDVKPGEMLLTRIKDGEVLSTVTAVNPRKE